MNREQRRKQKREGREHGVVEVTAKVVARGEVTISGVSWPFIMGRAYLLAARAGLDPPAAVPRLRPEGLALAQVRLTQPTREHSGPDGAASALLDIERALCEVRGGEMLGADPQLVGHIKEQLGTQVARDLALEVDGHTYDWQFIRLALGFVNRAQWLVVGLLDTDDGTALRLDAPDMRLLVTEVLRWTGPGLTLLNRAQMDVLERTGGDA